MAIVVQLRRNSAAELIIKNPLLMEGELGYELDTKRIKIGDGFLNWSDLPYTDDEYVKKIVGKGLSTEDYTAAEKTKLSGLTQYTDELAQDATVSLVSNGTHTGISFSYNDANNSLSATVSGGGGGSSITRYEAGAGTGCYVLATGTGVTISKTSNIAVFSTPVGVQILSASIHFLSTEIGANVNCTIDFGINQGTGDNSSYTSLFAPQFQCFVDLSGARIQKSAASGNFNPNSHSMQITSLSANQAIWVNLSF